MPRKKASVRTTSYTAVPTGMVFHAISFKCRIGDPPVVHPANPAIHNVREQGSVTQVSKIPRTPSQVVCSSLFPSFVWFVRGGLCDGLSSPARSYHPGVSIARRPCRLPSKSCKAAKDGGASRDRTGDLKLAKLALSQLSYGPVDPCSGPGGPGTS